jgi:hypothetical protein
MPVALPDDVPIGLVIIQHWKVPILASNFPHSSESRAVWHHFISLLMQTISAHFIQRSMTISLPDDVLIGLVIVQHWKVPILASNFTCSSELCAVWHHFVSLLMQMISAHFIQRSMLISLPDDVPIGLVIIQHWKVPNLASNFLHSCESCAMLHQFISLLMHTISAHFI